MLVALKCYMCTWDYTDNTNITITVKNRPISDLWLISRDSIYNPPQKKRVSANGMHKGILGLCMQL